MIEAMPTGKAHGCATPPDAACTVEWLHGSSPTAALSRYARTGGADEIHVMTYGEDTVESLEKNWLAALTEVGLCPESTVMRRVFCSDVATQAPQLDSFSRAYPGGFSAIGQAPLEGGRLALWSYHATEGHEPLAGNGDGACFTLRRGALRHVWISGLCATSSEDAATQTHAVLDQHDQLLADSGMSLEDDVIRTWWYVRDIDADYQGLVEARRDVFACHDLTENTHYIASTGIAGGHSQPAARLSLDSYAIRGLVPGQIEYLSAPTHLGPTHLYGVTFERATAIHYADRTHIFLSGTASIDPSGNVVHPGNVLRQLQRSLENIEALLTSASARLSDLSMILVYLRNPADGPEVGRMLRQRLDGLPMILLHAPVCRPGWLIEIEGIACISRDQPNFPYF